MSSEKRNSNTQCLTLTDFPPCIVGSDEGTTKRESGENEEYGIPSRIYRKKFRLYSVESLGGHPIMGFSNSTRLGITILLAPQ